MISLNVRNEVFSAYIRQHTYDIVRLHTVSRLRNRIYSWMVLWLTRSLIATQDGIELYNKLFKSEKYQAIGVIKNIGNPIFTKFARALNPR